LSAALKGKRVLITGGLGFIGSNLAHHCLALGAEVTVYDCLDARSGGNMANLAGIRDDLRLVRDDIRNFEGVRAAVLGQDLVFHCAAYTSHPLSMREPYVDIEVNCKGTIQVLEALRHFNPEAKLVHVGTSTQVGAMQYSPVDEDHPEFPADLYSANKSASEKYVLVYGRAYGLQVSVLRLANTYGPRSNIRDPDFGFVNYFVGLALRNREIRVFGDGSQVRTIAYIDDVVDALVRAGLAGKASGRVYFAVGHEHRTVAEIAEVIARELGGSVKFTPWPRDRGGIEIGDAVISNRRIREELGAEFPVGLEQGLARTRDYFSPRLDDYLRG
jgi:UDP-glucose 4-epimerase